MSNKPPFRLIWEGEWNDIVCADYPITPERYVEEDLHPLVNTHVDCLLYNLCSSDAYVCELETGELMMRSVEQFDDAWCWRYRENTRRMVEADANPPQLAVDFGHRYGLTVLPVVRMNDPHDQFFKFEWSDFKRAHPEYLLGDVESRDLGFRPKKALPPESVESTMWGMFDFRHQEVRAHRLAIIDEFITRWGNDGLMLDFDRDPYYFCDGTSAENQALMTDLIRQVRATLDRLEKERGRRQYLMVRVLGDVELTTSRGLDVRTWIDEGFVQFVVPGSGYTPLELDSAPWLKLVEGHECWIYAGKNHWSRTEETRAWASAMYQAGAHGLYLFNNGHLLYGHPPGASPESERTGTVWYSELHPEYYRALNEIGDARSIAYLDKVYSLTNIDREGSGRRQRDYRGLDAPLPITLSPGTHPLSLRIGDDLVAAKDLGIHPRATLRVVIHNYTYPDEFHVLVNGTRLDDEKRSIRAVFIMNNDSVVSYPIPAKALRTGLNSIEIVVEKSNPQMAKLPELTSLQVHIEYRGGLDSASHWVGKSFRQNVEGSSTA